MLSSNLSCFIVLLPGFSFFILIKGEDPNAR